MSASSSKSKSGGISKTLGFVSVFALSLYMIGMLQAFYTILRAAYNIRMYAIENYGRVIHEFDPYFNYRATEYLWANGWNAFAHWYDTMVWYPLGRPVGTTIYPGMQVTSVAIKKYLLPDWSINDVCCFVPAWFGSFATFGVALLTYECTIDAQSFGSFLTRVPLFAYPYEKLVIPVVSWGMTQLKNFTGSQWGLNKPGETRPMPAFECALFAAAIMSVVPAHLMRSIGGGYDNESVATTAMVFTFWTWTRSLRDRQPLWMTTIWGVITGLCYFYMVAAWGGYVFVVNLIGVHATMLVMWGRFSSKVHRAYTAFYVVGTALATQVPVVGMTPLRSLEQLGPFVALVGIQLLEYANVQQRKKGLNQWELWKLRFRVFALASLVAAVLIFVLAPNGYFGPLSSRIRGLFVKHTKTGNPLVDSVAEHQAASSTAYFQYLNDVCYIAPVGLGIVCLLYFNDSSSFLLVYAIAAYYFSLRMVRLILLTAPIASVLGGIALGHLWSWMVGSIFTNTPTFLAAWEHLLEEDGAESEPTPTVVVQAITAEPEEKREGKEGKKDNKKGKKKKSDHKPTVEVAKVVPLEKRTTSVAKGPGDPILIKAIRFIVSLYVIWDFKPRAEAFYDICDRMAQQLSHPTIIQKGRLKDGREVFIDDYRDAYFWLRDNTPEDARIMAWWDYGYQITGISNRTTIADGNTWNHEHIALLGRTLTSPEKEGHRIARHLADYILVWAGGGGDDLAKSPHLIRIANSVYRGLCPEPTCRHFGFYSDGTPSPQMGDSMLYKLHSAGIKPGVDVDRNRFRLVFNSKYGKVRIWKILKVSKESKDWVEDKANKLCDPGGWLCRGQYPPALQKILEQKQDFKQLEDFNVKGSDDSEYQKAYMENLLGGGGGGAGSRSPPPQSGGDKKQVKKLREEEIYMLNQDWKDTEITSTMWSLIHEGKARELLEFFAYKPEAAHSRSKDGRGPMWWAHEYNQGTIVKMLKKLGVSDDLKDAKGRTPLDL